MSAARRALAAAAAAALLLFIYGFEAPGKRGTGAPTASPQPDVSTVVISAHTRDLTDSTGVYAEWPANPDVVVLNNSSGTAAMFWDNVNFLASNTAVMDSAGYDRSNLYAVMRSHSAQQSPHYTGSDTIGGHLFLKFNMKPYIPDDAYIVSAKLCLTPAQSITASTNQHMYAVLDTAAVDTGWYHPATMPTAQPMMRQATWNRMRGGDASSGWAANGAKPFRWRDDLWDFGIPCNPGDGPGGETANTSFSIDVSKPLQWWVWGGKQGNPFWVLRSRRSSASHYYYLHHAAQGVRKPALIVTYRTDKKWQPAFGAAPVVVAFQTDDQDTCNIEYARILERYGFRFTIFTNGLTPWNGSTNAARITMADVHDLIAAGHEFGVHGTTHCETANDNVYGWGDISPTNADSIIALSYPGYWLGELEIGDRGPWQFRSSAAPCGGMHPLLYSALRSKGILWCRAAAGYNAYAVWGTPAGGGQPRAALMDSVWMLRLDRAVPMYSMAYSTDHPRLFGSKAQSLATTRISRPGLPSDPAGSADTTLVEAFYDAIGNCQLNGNAPLMFFCHATKQNTNYVYGIDYDELEWLAQECANNPYITMDTSINVVRSFMAHARPVDAPAWTKDSTVRAITAADSAWYYSARRY